jgi:hypothetical protein
MVKCAKVSSSHEHNYYIVCMLVALLFTRLNRRARLKLRTSTACWIIRISSSSGRTESDMAVVEIQVLG